MFIWEETTQFFQIYRAGEMRRDSERTRPVAPPSALFCERKLLDRKMSPALGYEADLLCGIVFNFVNNRKIK